jgi:prepilin-type N-terminal cleavage/methylation domain-containing protein
MRYAFTMIELIFAIVVIAITVVSLPMMMQVNSKGIEGNIVQEAIFAASTKLMQVTTYPWDENSIDLNSSARAFILNLTNAPASYTASTNIYGRSPDTSSNFRIGHIHQDTHRRFQRNDDSNTTDDVSALGSSGRDGIDEQSGTYSFESESPSNTGYKNKYRNIISVSYIQDTGTPYVFSDSGSSTPTNMKLIEVSIEAENAAGTWEEITLLRSYAANIGEADYHSRTY